MIIFQYDSGMFHWGDARKPFWWAPVSFPSFPANAQRFYTSVGLWMQEQEPINQDITGRTENLRLLLLSNLSKIRTRSDSATHRGTRSCAAFLPESLSNCCTHRWNSQKSIIPMVHLWHPEIKNSELPSIRHLELLPQLLRSLARTTMMVPSWSTGSQQWKPGLLFFEKLLTLLLQLFFGLILSHGSNMMRYIYNVHDQAAPVVWLLFLSISKPEDSSHFKGSSESRLISYQRTCGLPQLQAKLICHGPPLWQEWNTKQLSTGKSASAAVVRPGDKFVHSWRGWYLHGPKQPVEYSW